MRRSGGCERNADCDSQIMEAIAAQNSALYFAQHKASKRRTALFQQLPNVASKRGPDLRQQLNFGDLFNLQRFHQGKAR